MATSIDIERLLYWAFRQEQVETRRNPHEDALTVYWAVEALPDPYCGLVKRQSRLGQPPDWRLDPTRIVVDLPALRQARARYAAWHKALEVLQQTVNGALQSHHVTGPSAARTPWTSRSVVIGNRQRAS